MSKTPGLRVSTPCDQPTRYLAVGLVSLARLLDERAARREELERTRWRSDAKCAGRSLTTRIPSDSGPNAASSVSNETVPDSRSFIETITGWATFVGICAFDIFGVGGGLICLGCLEKEFGGVKHPRGELLL